MKVAAVRCWTRGGCVLVPVCPGGVGDPASPTRVNARARDRARMPGVPSQCCRALGLLFTHHTILEAVFLKGSKNRR